MLARNIKSMEQSSSWETKRFPLKAREPRCVLDILVSRSPAEIVGSNPTGGMDVLSVVSVLCCQVEVSATGWSLVQRSPTDCVRRRVWSRKNLKNEAMTRAGSQRHKKSKQNKYKWTLYTTLFVITYQRHVSAIKAIFIPNTKSWHCNINLLYDFVCILKMAFMAETCR